MKPYPGLSPKYHVERALPTPDMLVSRPHLAAPYFDAKAKRLVATDGHMLAVLPLTGRVKGTKAPKVGRPFPDWKKILPPYKADDKGTVTVALDATLLARLADAIGAANGRQRLVELTFPAVRRGEQMLDVILVKECVFGGDGEPPAATGVLMPVLRRVL